MSGLPPRLNRLEWMMRSAWQLDLDRIAGGNDAGSDDDPHDSSFPDQFAVSATIENGRHESVLEAVKLNAGVAEAGHLDDRRSAKAKV